jgi:hypothetical protein
MDGEVRCMSSMGVPNVFEYATTVVAPRKLRWSAVLRFVASLAGLAVPFMPFACGTSPLGAVTTSFDRNSSVDSDMLLCLGCGFFVALPLVTWRALLLWRPPGPRLRRAALGVAIVTWIPYAWVQVLWLKALPDSFADGATLRDFIGDQYPWILGLCAALACLLLAWRLWTRGEHNAGLRTALLSAWLGTAVFCVVGFYEDLEVGGYVTLPLMTLWASEAAYDCVRLIARRWRSRVT